MKRALAVLLVLAGAFVALLALRPEPQREPPPGRGASEPARAAEAPTRTSLAPADPSAVAARAALPVAEDAPRRTLTVAVRSTASYTPDSAAVAGIAFEILPQTHSALPFPALPLDPASAPLARGRTDADGRSLVELDASVRLHANGSPALLGRVVEPGHEERIAVVRAVSDSPGAFEIALLVRAGATAYGRVVDTQEAPVDARVALRTWRVQQGVRRLDRGGSASTLADGWFQLHYDEPVSDGMLVAEADERGTGVLTSVALTLDAPPRDLRVVVAGPGVLTGHVVDGNGEPAGGVDLFCVLPELDDGDGWPLPEPLASLRAIEGGGRLSHGLRTGADGSFRVAGLRAQPYVLRALVDGRALALTPRPVLADGAELELRLARPHLLVHLLDSEGRALESAPLAPSSRTRWPEVPHARVFDCVADEGAPCTAGDARATKRLDASRTVCEVDAGTHYLVLALGPGFDGVPRRVELPYGGDRVDVELRARAEPQGAVAVRVVSGGREVLRQAEVWLESVEHAARLLVAEEYREPGPIRFEAPAGFYRVVVEGRPNLDMHHGSLMAARELGRAEAEVQIRPDSTQELELELLPGARIAVSLAGEASATDRVATRAAEPWLDEPGREAELERWASSAKLSLLRPGRRPEALVFAESVDRFSKHLAVRWPLGATHTAEIVPAGRHVLVGRLPGGREARAEVELRAGETLAVELRFPDASGPR